MHWERATSQARGISELQRQQYHRDGYLILREFFTPEQMAEVARDAELATRRSELIHTDNLRCRWQDHIETGQCLFDAFDPINDLAPACAKLSVDERLLAVLGALYGERACLFKDKLIYKPPGAKGYGLHQDYIAWPSFPRSFLSVIVPIDAASQDNGCTEVFTGYHQDVMSEPDGDYHELSMEQVEPARGVMLRLEVGDIAVFSGLTPHRSGPNRSATSRRQLYFSYNKLSDGGEQREKHYQEFHAWLRKKYGEYGRHNVYFQ